VIETLIFSCRIDKLYDAKQEHELLGHMQLGGIGLVPPEFNDNKVTYLWYGIMGSGAT